MTPMRAQPWLISPARGGTTTPSTEEQNQTTVMLQVEKLEAQLVKLGTLHNRGFSAHEVSANDAEQIAEIKGLVTGTVNLAIAGMLGIHLPAIGTMLTAGMIGFCGYGLSLVLFVLALRHLGTARTSAYFSVAPLPVLSFRYVCWAKYWTLYSGSRHRLWDSVSGCI
ncbi:MAG: hypothetical protein ACXWJK_10850 [Burkholderiaceae bacterium]